LEYSRYFYQDEETVISVCNYCFAVVAESSVEAELDRCEREHACGDKSRAFAA
jgi:hypothetical protein